jgi:hypothetical protein
MSGINSKKVYETGLNSWLELIANLSQLQSTISSESEHTESTIANRDSIKNEYERRGFIAITLPPEIRSALNGYFDAERKMAFSCSDCSLTYLPGINDAEVESLLNKDMVYFSPPEPNAAENLQNLLSALKPYIEAAIGGGFRVGNVRAWTTRKTSEQHGPIKFHTDRLSRHLRKLMIYPVPPNRANGSFEIIGRDGETITLNSTSNPMAVLADVGVLQHRGIPPSAVEHRPVIEVTIIPSLQTKIVVDFFGHNARLPLLSRTDFAEVQAAFSALRKEFQHQTDDSLEPIRLEFERCVNIGGGRRFNYPGWVNFDIASPEIASRLMFDNDCRLPYPNNHATVVYSSHCLEHLEDDVVRQLLHETARIMSPDGALVIKIPDFELVLNDWKTGKLDGILDPRKWGLVPLFGMWTRNGIPVSADSIAAMIFCGFWNTDYGEEFFGANSRGAPSAWHGPPRIPISTLRHILGSSESPHFVASQLRAEVLRTERSPRFNHCNAWSRAEFVALAESCGLRWIDTDDIVAHFPDIPTVDDMASISRYFLFSRQN